MTKTSFRLEGLKELETALLELPKGSQGNVLKRAVTIPAADFAEYASSLAPKARGKLKAEIKVGKAKIISPGKAAFAAAMKEGGTRGEAAMAARSANRAAGGTGKSVSVQVGPTQDAYYGMFQEFGTRHHAAKPFMRPAWDSMKEGMAQSIADTLAEQIEKTRQRLAKRAERLAAKMR